MGFDDWRVQIAAKHSAEGQAHEIQCLSQQVLELRKQLEEATEQMELKQHAEASLLDLSHSCLVSQRKSNPT